jgi:hypothetical protein
LREGRGWGVLIIGHDPYKFERLKRIDFLQNRTLQNSVNFDIFLRLDKKSDMVQEKISEILPQN